MLLSTINDYKCSGTIDIRGTLVFIVACTQNDIIGYYSYCSSNHMLPRMARVLFHHSWIQIIILL